MEDLLMFLAAFVAFCAYSVGIAMILFKVFFPSVPAAGLINSKASLEERQATLSQTVRFNPQIQLFNLKTQE